MERTWDEGCFADALRCWDSGQGADDTIRQARERQAVRYFWAALGMARPDCELGETARQTPERAVSPPRRRSGTCKP